MNEPEQLHEQSLAERAAELIPGGSSTGSKQYQAIYGEAAEGDLPSHYISAAGCEITLSDGSVIIDCSMALGAVAIGYADEPVTHAVMRAVGTGSVCAFPPVLELDLAERLAEIIPIAERVRFLKTGAEGTAAAVRLARAATGRSHVIGSGYFGWLDWCSQQPGVPVSVQNDFTAAPFNDIPALEAHAARVGNELAAIILEPVVEVLADEPFVRRARELCDAVGAVLIFDEVKTGFRLRTGGYQEYSGIAPDVAVFGKALANGFPLSAVVGKADILDHPSKSWISSTMACEAGALAAAGAVLDWHERAEVCEALWSTGEEMRRRVAGAITACGITGVEVRGIDPMWFIHFDDPARESAFLSRALRHGVLFKRGPYNFASLSHDDDALEAIEYAASSALVDIMESEAGGDEDGASAR